MERIHRKHLFQIMANELKMPHFVVSCIYCALQGVIAIGLILTEQRYWFAFGVVVVLSTVYVIFMKKFFGFGKDPNRFYPNIKVKIGRFVNDDADLRFQDVIEGNIIDILYNTINVLGYKYLVKEIDFRGILRIEKGEYPLAAIREMLLNAIIHRTYMGATVQLRVYNDKITIWNDGGLPADLDIESLKRNHNSKPRNPLIADVCFKAGYIDSWGRGTLKIINSCLESELPEPEIIERDGGVLVTVYKSINGSQLGLADIKVGGQVGGQVGSVISDAIESLTERQKKVYELIIADPKTSRKQLANILGINESAVQKHIEILKKKRLIEREGETTGYWIIKS